MTRITLETTVEAILAAVPGAAAIFARHGCEVEATCPEGIQTLPLGEVEFICDLDDMTGLLAELNAEAA